MKTLMVKCKHCGKNFPSPFQMDEANFNEPSNVLAGNVYQCPHCGKTAAYDKKDHSFE